jgi:MFS family permease
MTTSVRSDENATAVPRMRAVIASTVGTTIEWYDFFLYNTASALIFPALFFPKQAAYTGILLSFGTQFVGFAARPIGAAFFGHFGDRAGRKAMLVVTLILMGVSTFLIGLLPGFSALGYTAPVLLVLLRILQGLGVGGEWGGSVLMSMEWGNRRRRGLMASWPQLGVPLGLALSTGLFTLMSNTTGAHFTSWGWRVPFLLSIVLVGVGLYVRLRVLETPEFSAVREQQAVERQPLLVVIRRQWATILGSAFIRMSEQAPFYIFTVFVLTYCTTVLKLTRTQVLNDVTIAALVGLITVPLFGYLSDLVGRRLLYGIGIVCMAVYAFPYFGLLDTKHTGLIMLAIVISLMVHDMQYGPQAALIAEGFGPNVRYSGAGLGYQLASVVAGGPAPLIATKILSTTGSARGVSWYILGCCAVAMIALLLLPRRIADATPVQMPIHNAVPEGVTT